MDDQIPETYYSPDTKYPEREDRTGYLPKEDTELVQEALDLQYQAAVLLSRANAKLIDVVTRNRRTSKAKVIAAVEETIILGNTCYSMQRILDRQMRCHLAVGTKVPAKSPSDQTISLFRVTQVPLCLYWP